MAHYRGHRIMDKSTSGKVKFKVTHQIDDHAQSLNDLRDIQDFTIDVDAATIARHDAIVNDYSNIDSNTPLFFEMSPDGANNTEKSLTEFSLIIPEHDHGPGVDAVVMFSIGAAFIASIITFYVAKALFSK